MLGSNGLVGYLKLSGAVLLELIIIVVNFKIMAMSSGVKPLNTICIIISIALYWVSQWLMGIIFGDRYELVILDEEWSYVPMLWMLFILVFFLVFVEYAYEKYKIFKTQYDLIKKKEVIADGLFDKLDK